MILSKEFYDKCDPSYKKVIDELEQSLTEVQAKHDGDEAAKFEEVKSAIFEFSSKYLTPKEYWEYCISLIPAEEFSEEWKELCYIINAKAYLHFYFDNWMNLIRFPGTNKDIYLELLDYKNKDDLDEHMYFVDGRDLSYPHSYLKKCFREFESHETSPLPKEFLKKYEDMKALYSKIKAAEEDVEQWFKLLLEFGRDGFIMHNVEYRLGENLLDTKLWKLYLKFLKDHDAHTLLLFAYSRYTRFFLDDTEMMEEYKKALNEYGPCVFLWDNLTEFEIDNECNDEELKMLIDECDRSKEKAKESEDGKIEDSDVETKEIEPFDKNLCSTFYDTYQVQNFSLPAPLIVYILKNANHQVLRKLFSACRYFFANKPTPLCYRLRSTADKTKFVDETLWLEYGKNQFLKNIFVTTALKIDHDEDRNYLSSIIPLIYQCEAKYVTIVDQYLSFNELKLLIQHGGVVQLDFQLFFNHDEYKCDDYILVDIMECLPNIERLSLPKAVVNAKTAHDLNMLTFKGKIDYFDISIVTGQPFDSNEFLKYCITNRDDNFSLSFHFSNEFNEEFVKKFEEILEEYFESCYGSYTSLCIN